MFLPKVIIAHLSQYSDYFSFVNLLMTCKTYYKYKPLIEKLYGYKRIDYGRMINIINGKLDYYNVHTIDQYTQIKINENYREFYFNPKKSLFPPKNEKVKNCLFSLDTEQAKIVIQFIKYIINKTVDRAHIHAYTFRLSEFYTIELFKIRNLSKPKNENCEACSKKKHCVI